MTRRAFTIVELLVVCAVIALLLGMLLPGLRAAGAAARQSRCQSNLRQLTAAAFAYANLNNQAMPAAILHFQESGTVRTASWDYQMRQGALVPGLLWSYLDAPSAVQGCPDHDAPPQEGAEPFTGYNYNTSYIGAEGGPPVLGSDGQTLDGWRTARLGRPITSFARPDRVALLGDGGWRGGPNKYMRAPMNTVEGNLAVCCAGGQAFRHAGGCTCVACLDGHVESVAHPCRGQLTTDALATMVLDFPTNGFLSQDDAAYGGP